MWKLLFLLPAILTAAILVTSFVRGEAFNPERWSGPLIIKRSDRSGKYWAGVAVEIVWFAFAVVWGVGMVFG
ncbi:hypothetical protein [Rhizomicrobium electricum]|jgi:hypothetical protein|uniref:hypothetical protein n=1 Tax=Rhizomicrobium electricum TaxID=480070 RepID=UPI001423C07C|nr:hypothetical protein [Rhizomicrobium electricum]NIJ49141.1 hypothetical protein [Rhizomicrobium electricum]